MIQYVAGFFDADGCVMLLSPGKGKMKAPAIVFTNNEKSILEDIRACLGPDGSSLTCHGGKSRHNVTYNLSYRHRHALRVLKMLKPHIRHAHKKHKAEILLGYYVRCTPRNGRYTETQLMERRIMEEQFHAFRSGQSGKLRVNGI